MKKKIIIGLFLSIVIAFSTLMFFLRNAHPIRLAYMTDSKYLPYMMTSLYSAIKNKNSQTKYEVHVIAQDFMKEDAQNLQKMETEDVQIFIHQTKDVKLDEKHLGRFASFNIALQKLFIAEYLADIDKVLYLDADTLIEEDLSEIYNTPLRGYYAAAVKDGLMYQFPDHTSGLNLHGRDFYFNSGIMLLNLNKIRKDDVLRSAIIYFNTHEDVFGDQDVLNFVFADKVKKISYRYNCNSTFFEEKDAEFLSEFYGEEIPSTSREVYENAAILHFAGYKPWTDWFKHSYLKPLWEQYAEEMRAKYQIAY